MEKISKSDAHWREQLGDEGFRICRRGGTEPAFSGRYCDQKEPGEYRCNCCDAPLFSSRHKYDSGSGWPSYWQPTPGALLEELADTSHGMTRTEVRCGRCEAHLGHLFADGPPPTGQRYCINSASLRFVPDSEAP